MVIFTKKFGTLDPPLDPPTQFETKSQINSGFFWHLPLPRCWSLPLIKRQSLLFALIKSLRWKQLPLHSHWLRFFGFSPVSAHIEQCIMFKFIQSHTGHTDNTDSTPSQWHWPFANQCPLISLYSSPVLSQKLAKWPRISHSGHIVTDSLTSC